MKQSMTGTAMSSCRVSRSDTARIGVCVLLIGCLLLASPAVGVGNEVITDSETALQAGIEAIDVRQGERRLGANAGFVSFRIKSALSYDFGEMGVRGLSGIRIIRPDPGTDPGPRLIGSDSSIPVSFEIDGDYAFTAPIRLRRAELIGSYFEFSYAIDQGMVPLLVHIRGCVLLDLCDPSDHGNQEAVDGPNSYRVGL